MAMAFGFLNGGSSSSSSASSTSWIQTQRGSFLKNNNRKAHHKNVVSCVASSYSASTSSSLSDQYRTLRIQPGGSESEVKKAFRQLALQYHPDVCKENNSGVQFHRINEAYDAVMSYLRGDQEDSMVDQYDYNDADEPMRGMCDPDWDMWEEWMGWEGAGIRDYTSHINPYI